LVYSGSMTAIRIQVFTPKFRTIALALTVAAPAQNALCGQFDWPQWQGPDRNAVSKETGLLKEWPQDGPPLAWRVGDLGGGFSAPSIVGGRIFGMSNRGSDEVAWALSETNGKELWVTRLGPAYQGQGMPQGSEGPGAIPTVDGDRLYVVGDAGNLVCLNVENGAIVWQKNFVTDFGGTAPNWAYRESPLVDGDELICAPGSNKAMLKRAAPWTN